MKVGDIVDAEVTRVESFGMWLRYEHDTLFVELPDAVVERTPDLRLRYRVGDRACIKAVFENTQLESAFRGVVMTDVAIAWYRDFYDVPRLICIRVPDGYVRLDCAFDDQLDEYSDAFDVAMIRSVSELSQDDVIAARAEAIDRVAVREVQFDETRRTRIKVPASYLRKCT